MDKRDFTIGLLTTTATILLVGVLILQTRTSPVYADGMTVSSGDYVMTVGAIDDPDEEYVYVIDLPSEKMIAYRFDSTRGRINLVQGIDLTQLNESKANTNKNNNQRRRP